MSGARALILIGGGEHARVVAEAARHAVTPVELLGFVDPGACEETVRRLGLPRLGDDEALREHREALGVLGFGALGSVPLREKVVARAQGWLAGWATVIHRAAWVAPTAEVHEGSVIMAGAVVQTGARIGAHCIVNSGAIVEHDVALGDHTHVAPGVVLGGGVAVSAGAFIGLGARVRDHVRIGRGAVVGMGAVVLRDVDDGGRVMGVPAR